MKKFTLRNLPGIIIEHAFITNTEDVNKYLKTEAGIKKLGVADASGIAKYFGVNKGIWKTDRKGNKYYYVSDLKVIGEKKMNGKWYLFKELTGTIAKGETMINGKSNYFRESTGELLKNGFANHKYYGTNGVLISVSMEIFFIKFQEIVL